MAILRFRHRGLERFYFRGTTAGIQSKHAQRLRLILGRLNVAVEPKDIFLGSDVTDVDYEDYH